MWSLFSTGLMEKYCRRRGFCFPVPVGSRSGLLSSKGSLSGTNTGLPMYTQLPRHPGLAAWVASLDLSSCSVDAFARTQLLQPIRLPEHPAPAALEGSPAPGSCSVLQPVALSTRHLPWHPSRMMCRGLPPVRSFPMIGCLWNPRAQLSGKFYQHGTTVTLLPCSGP